MADQFIWNLTSFEKKITDKLIIHGRSLNSTSQKWTVQTERTNWIQSIKNFQFGPFAALKIDVLYLDRWTFWQRTVMQIGVSKEDARETLCFLFSPGSIHWFTYSAHPIRFSTLPVENPKNSFDFNEMK